MTGCKTGRFEAKYNIVMDIEAFIEKIKKEGFWDYIHYFKEWNGYEVFIVGMDGSEADLGDDQVILAKENSYKFATGKDRLEILEML